MTVVMHDLECEVRAPQSARRWVAECLRAQLGDGSQTRMLIDDAVLCISELVTNAVHAGCSRLRVELRVDDESVRVSVLDDAPGQPTPRLAGPADVNGRGLRLVEAMARRWGVEAAEAGKAVWAELVRGT